MTNDSFISNIVEWNSQKVKYTWIPGADTHSFVPFTQVYGIAFNDEGKVLVIQEKEVWKIPGGTVELGEAPEETFIREFNEETDVSLKNIKFIGALRVEFLDQENPNKNEGNTFYQLRFIADVDKILTQTPDPDGGEIHPRKFIPLDDLIKISNWGETGKAMFEEAAAKHKTK